MKSLIILKSNFDDSKPWGGDKLKDYGYTGNSDQIGEAYLISGLKERPSIINDSEISENNLYDFYRNNPEWFGNYKGEYPLLSKLIDAKEDLSVQVHPNNEYAKNKFNKLGKTECWYILDCPENTEIVYGLTSKNINDVKEAINSSEWDKILNTQNINPGDVLYIPSGTVHAIKKNTFLFEIQQSSDLTFRLYDYDRVDAKGNKRDLHIEDSLNTIDFDSTNVISKVKNNKMIDCDYFTTEIFDINGIKEFEYNNVYWVELVVLESDFISINGIRLQKGESAIIRNNTKFTLVGKAKVALTYIRK